jgi:hypothetical protein
MADERERIEIYLVPGFMGFTRLEGLHYYLGVADVLRARLWEVGLDARVHATDTKPAGSLHQRAAKLALEIAERHRSRATSIHLVGHSTGGLDVRLLLSPGSALDCDGAVVQAMGARPAARYREALPKVRTAVGVAAPHYGTPIASLAVRLSFETVLRGLGTAVRLPLIRHALALGLLAGASATGLLKTLTLQPSFLSWIDASVLGRNPLTVLGYLDSIGRDVGALRNLTQETTDLANALLRQRPDVHYGSIVTGTNQPAGPIDTADPILYVNTTAFRIAWNVMAMRDPGFAYAPRVDELQSRHAADAAAGLDVGVLGIDGDRTGDGVVPSASQAYGDILGVFASDHLDCVGHFPHALPDGTFVSGWVRSGAAFTPERFALMWGRVAAFIAASLGRTLVATPPQPAAPIDVGCCTTP